jgi:Na+-transporting NADH:ubiquinone oxidoreductase subunit A
MSNHLELKKGLDIPLGGAAAHEVHKTVKSGTIALKPTDFKGLIPRLLVKEGDAVLAGSPVYASKTDARILFTSPVSGVVEKIVRGEKRKLLAITVKADDVQKHADFPAKAPASADEFKELLLNSGLWPCLVQRPYGVMANPDGLPKAIFISAFSTAPLAPDTEFTLGGSVADIQLAVNALKLFAPVHVSVKEEGSAFAKLENATIHVIKGKHPAGNVGVQISHISPILKGQTVWTVSLMHAAAIGRLIRTGKVDLSRKIAVTGPLAPTPAYVETIPGEPVAELAAIPREVRVIGGDVLSGENLGKDNWLGFFQDQLTLVNEGPEREILGWAKPFRFNLHSSSMCYFSWLQKIFVPDKTFDMDTNLHGGPRAFVETKCFEDVTPMDIFPIYLIKACLAGDIDKMEKFGIYEVLPEDLALCDYVDPSKNDIQAIIQGGIDLMIKEMA